jgi:hypothetical protein
LKLISSFTIGLILIIFALFLTGNVRATSQQIHCNSYSDNFDSFNPDRWQEVLLYSVTQGTVRVDKGQLVLNAPENQPTEIQLYSLFTFEGDFDIQAEFEIEYPDDMASCRLNAGLVMQTLDDKTRYKCYVSKTPGNRLLFRGRLDLYDNETLEKDKMRPAVPKGAIRIVRKKGRITYLTLLNSQWVEVHSFNKPNTEKLRLRFKLQTFIHGSNKMTCPATVKFDNFKVNVCHNIIVE